MIHHLICKTIFSVQDSVAIQISKSNSTVNFAFYTLDTILVIMIGLNSEQLKRLAISGRQFQKTARRDIAHVVSALHTRNYSFPGSALSAVLLLFTQEK